MYQSPDRSVWKGRNDPGQTELDHLWHHVIRSLDLGSSIAVSDKADIAFLGFVSDEGVRRNKGRVGAKDGPDVLRTAMSNFAVHFEQGKHKLYDAGNVVTSQGRLEEAQQELGRKVKLLLDHGYFPILLGGGHEIAYGHFCGIRDHLGREGAIGIINFDAHFDLRSYTQGAHSGSPFRQILEDCQSRGKGFHYFPLGINEASNTRTLFDVMHKYHQNYVLREDLRFDTLSLMRERIESFIHKVDHIYVTLDLDVIAGAFAPGVSAPAPVGVLPQLIHELMHYVVQSGKVISLDVAELNPTYDDGRTAKLAAQFVYQVVMSFFN